MPTTERMDGHAPAAPVGAQRGGGLPAAALVLAAYVLGGRIGLAVPFTSGNVSPIWPPAGIALAATVLFGYRVWPALAAGAFLVNYFSPVPALAALGIAVGNAAGPLAAAWLLRRLLDFRPSLTRLRDVLGLIVLGALGGTAISATIGTLVLCLIHVNAWSSVGSSWLIWWLGDAMGVLIVAPLVLTALGLREIGGRRLLELLALLCGTAGVCVLVFTTRSGMGHDILTLVLFPFVIWGAIRFEAAGASIAAAVIAAAAVWNTARGFGPFVGSTSLENAALMQSFLTVIAVSGLSLAALVTERTQLIRERAEQEAAAQGKQARNTIVLLSRAVEQTADSVIVTDRGGIIEYVNPAFERTTGYGRDEAIGRTPAILKSGRHGREFYQRLWSNILGGRPFRGTLVNRKRSGDLYWAEQTITPITDDQGEITHFVSVLKDITELRRKQEQEVQLGLARRVQQQFQRAPIELPGLDVAAVSYPAAETGGDFFDFIPAAPDAMYVAIGDASGHGFSSALVIALTRAYVRSLALLDLGVSEILSRVNRMLVADLDDNRFVTLFLARIDAQGRLLSYASAGHVPGYVLYHGGVHAVLESTGPPMGMFADSAFPPSEVRLEKNQTVLLVTDGVTDTDATDAEQFSAERLIEYVGTHRDWAAQQTAVGIYQAARAFAGTRPQADDITSVVMRVL